MDFEKLDKAVTEKAQKAKIMLQQVNGCNYGIHADFSIKPHIPQET